jgi:MFS family permease
MSQAMLRRAGAILVLAAGIQHLHVGLVLEFEEYFEEHLVIGIMFLIGAAAAIVAAFLLIAGPYRYGWLLGGLTVGGMLVGFLISRTVGLFGFDEIGWEHWNEPHVWLALLIEGLFMATLVAHLVAPQREERDVEVEVEVLPDTALVDRQPAQA